ncbi:hypothetical protein FA13DRAFT_1620302 [Coprinellus micaceus]|uniref:C2H2-type domain-containing protein n=1 Tax=Coprinellus micaceus TaxID=71717 RepID=A0A4Y7TZ98_COPMI|nr:hypothetical protein FA13DRAFT_1620302 [Coprinellus micaceus]
MSDFSSFQPSPEAFQHFDYSKANLNLEFLSFHSPNDLVAPPPDLFEFDVDSGLEGFEEQLQLFDTTTFNIPRGPAGPLSTLTTSGVSDSASDDIFSDISSFYNQNPSQPSFTTQSPNFDFKQIEMEFQRVRVTGSDYGAPQSLGLDDHSDSSVFGQMPTPPRSPPAPLGAASAKFHSRGSFSDYGPPRRSSSDIFSHLGYNGLGGNTVSPLHLTTQLPPLSTPNMAVEEIKGDPRKKYKCPSCPRSFARAYNLKTHMGTHDPNRLKPHVCPHRSCGRSFSRKHDLGRHLVSIHRDETLSAKKTIGVGAGNRSWCDTCGKGAVGANKGGCACHDVK